MKGEIRIVDEAYLKRISDQSLDGFAEYDKYQICLQQDGNIVTQGGEATCTSTTLSSAITLKQEIK